MNLQDRNLSTGMTGADVQLLQQELAQLGYASTDTSKKGETDIFGETTFAAVYNFQKQHQLQPTGIVDAETAKLINQAVDALNPPPQESVVQGQVSRPDKTLVAASVVQAFDLSMGSEQQLGQAITDAAGAFKISYAGEPFAARGGADLLVRVFDAQGGVLASSAVIHQAKLVEQVNLVTNGKLPVEDKPFIVAGQVLRSDQQPLVDATVQAFDISLDGEQQLGQAITDANGAFKISYAGEPFKARGGADLIVRVFDAQGVVLVSSAVIPKANPLEQVKLVTNGKLPVEEKPFVVRGTVRYADGKQGAGVTVCAFDRDLRSEEPLGNATTDAKGNYEIHYSPEQFLRAEKGHADLRVAAYDDQEQELVSSPIIFNAQPEARMDLSIGGEYRGPSEYENLLAELTPLVQGLSLDELTEDDQHQDITFLQHETGQDPLRIAFLVLAHRLTRKTDLAAAVFYGFFREGLPTSLPALLAQSPAIQRRALAAAAGKNIIPGHFATEIDQILERLKGLIVQQAFEQPAEAGKSSLGALLATTLADGKQQAVFLTAYVNHTGPLEEFWHGLQESPELKDHITDMQFTLQLGALTGNHLPLVQELKRRQNAGEIAELSDLARFDGSDWQAIIGGQNGDKLIGVPPDVPGENEEQKVRNYAQAMSNMVEDAFPTAFITHRLAKDDLIGKDDLLTFLSANPAFDLKTTRIDSYLREKPDAFGTIADVDGTKSRIKAMQRVYKLGPRYAQTSVLLKDGHDSAHAITRIGLSAFMAKYGDTFGTAQARDIHEKAHQTHAVALNLLVGFGPLIGRVATRAVPDGIATGVSAQQSMLSGGVGTPAMSAEVLSESGSIADWATLFGSLDLCDCDQCQSVHSPAAYFVDVLQFLKYRLSKIPCTSTKDILFGCRPDLVGCRPEIVGRRPDLGEIELTCENTNTPLPYVDLVNEVLEDAVAPPPPFEPFILLSSTEGDLDRRALSENLKRDFIHNRVSLSDAATINVKRKGEWWTIDDLAFTYTIHKSADGESRVTTRSRQTSGSAGERAANPQYVNKDAYAKLRDQVVFPWTLPLDLWSEETRTFLAQLGVQRHQIMEAFLPGERRAILANLALACEYLGLTAREADIITGVTVSQPEAASPGLWNLWGFEAAELTTEHSIPDPANSIEPISSGVWLNVLRGRVDVFLQQSGLAYRELLDLLDTNTINPVAPGRRAIQIVSTDAQNPTTCETKKLQLVDLDEAAAARIVRFVRLWRKLGWTMRDLDRALTAFGRLAPEVTNPINDKFIIQLSQVERLHRELGLPVIVLLSWWASIDTALYIDHSATAQPRAPSLYAQLFRNRAVTNPLDAGFPDDGSELNYDTTPSKKLTEHSATITAALGISAADFALLLNDSSVIPQIPDPSVPETNPDTRPRIPDDNLKLDHLSRLHRHATLARALHLSVQDYLTALRLVSVDPFANTADTLMFVEKIDKAGACGFSLAEINYLLRHEFTRSSGLAPDDNTVAAILGEMRSGLQKIAAENTFSEDHSEAGGATTDPNGELTRKKLALLNWSSPLIEMVVNTLNGSVTYETALTSLPAGLELPNDTGTYEVGLTTLPTGFSFPAELRGVVAHEAPFLFAVALRFAVELDGSRISNELREAFGNHSIALTTSATVTTQAPGESWQIADGSRVYSIVKREPHLTIYDEADKKLIASRFLTQPERALLRNAAPASENLTTAVAALFQRQDELQGKIGYDAGTHKLRFTGAMTVVRQTRLKGTSSDLPYQAYRAAIDALFAAPRDFVQRAMRTFSVQNFAVELAELPNSINPFPKALAGKVYFDPTTAPPKLHFVGPMLEQERDMLWALSTGNTELDASYKAAVNALLVPPNTTAPEASDAFLTEVDTAILFNGPTTPEARFELLLKKLLPYLRRTLSEHLVAQKIAGAFGLESRAVESLLARWVASPTDRSRSRRVVADFLDKTFAESNPNVKLLPGTFPIQFKACTLLHKIAVIATRFKLNARQLAWLFEYGPQVEWLDLNTLPTDRQDPAPSFERWLRLVDLFQLRDSLPAGETALDEVFSLARVVSVSGDALLKLVGDHTHWNASDLEDLVGATGFNLTIPTAFGDERTWLRLRACFDLLKRLGMSAKQCRDLAEGDVTAEEARGVVQAVRAKYDEAEWLNVAKPLRDVLREQQRAALVAYLAAHPNPTKGQHWKDANGLYAHFLIDVEMSPCMMTSRIKQAIGSTQLFVQRCLMNLEPDVAANAGVDPKWTEWKWMKNYRVWEANRKVFLYPENWIEPELRDDKSPFFKELEGELLQSDLTLETAETAFLNYLEKLDRVARLDIVGMYHQREAVQGGEIAVDILHVFGRTAAEPHIYYYRQRVDLAYWTAWERVELDIQGDHLIPVVWNRRLYLFWPTFTEKAQSFQLRLPDDFGRPVQGPDTAWEVKLAWSERKQGKWTSKKVSTQSFPLIPKIAPLASETSMFSFKSVIDADNRLTFLILSSDLIPHTVGSIGILGLRLDDSYGDPGLGGVTVHLAPPSTGTDFDRMFLTEVTDPEVTDPDDMPLFLPAPTDTVALNKTPGKFRLLPHHDGASIAQHPFFYQDDTRTFFVVPSGGQSPATWNNTSQIDPATIANAVKTYYPSSLFFAEDPTGVHPAELRFERSFPINPDPDLATLLANIVTSAFILPVPTTRPHYTFQTFYHPFVGAFVHELNRDGVDGMLQRKVQTDPASFLPRAPSGPLPLPLNFERAYEPRHPIVARPYPQEDVDFEYNGAYSLYNWELFFHAPLLIADQLSKNQRFEEAQKWFHYIFDPTDTSDASVPQRYWRTKKFYDTTDENYQAQRIQEILRLMAAEMDPVRRAAMSGPEREELVKYHDAVKVWRAQPFKPHLIARLRTTAYQKTVVMKYIDNLITWGDQLFRRDTIESINEATQLYILAAEILGQRPESIPPRAIARVQTYNSLEAKLDIFSGALVQVEEFVSPSGGSGVLDAGAHTPVTLPAMLYFCVPKNDKLLGYWDTVGDRLFKIRHCRNIEGVERQLPLFEPPIDPALLVRAAAAGVDISSALNDTNVALPYYRFNVLAQKASELCADLKSLGSALLSALEKRDAEELTLIRAGHETSLLELVGQVKEKQLAEAVQNQVALRKSRASAEARYAHYQKLLGVKGSVVPAEGQTITDQPDSALATTQATDGVRMIGNERAEMVALSEAHNYQKSAEELDRLANIAHLIPNGHIQPWGLGITFGGPALGTALATFASHFRTHAGELTYQANLSAKIGQFALRQHDWTLQSNLAAREIMQIDQQIIAAKIRIDIAAKELENHRQQVDNAREVEAYMRSKYTNQELYTWMVGQVAGVYFQTYQLAFDVARRAERSYRHELGLRDSNFIQFGYWDSLKKGLMAGEKLYHDLKRMEVTYLDQNKREYEITKHISLAQLDPMALLRLKQTGQCFVSVPEALFDLDFAGHYMRRIKAVNVTIPCVTGPYTGINCTFTLLKSSVRHSSVATGQYGRRANEQDARFTESFGAIESIVTSSGQNDSGLFEQNLHDERYLPFEGAGVISEWRLELPADVRQFDYDTISDVILQMRYTAREGGGLLRNSAVATLKAAIDEAQAAGSVRLFSIRHEFPTEWAKFQNQTPVAGQRFELALNLRKEHYPFWSQGRLERVQQLDILVRSANPINEIPASLDVFDQNGASAKTDRLAKVTALGNLLVGKFTAGATGIALPANPVGELRLFFDDKAIADLWIAVKWSNE